MQAASALWPRPYGLIALCLGLVRIISACWMRPLCDGIEQARRSQTQAACVIAGTGSFLPSSLE